MSEIDLSKYKGCKPLSRDLVNDLIAEVERLRGEVDRITKLHNALATTSSLQTGQLEAQRDELAGALRELKGLYEVLAIYDKGPSELKELDRARAALATAGGGE